MTMNWLKSNVLGFTELSGPERDAILHFVFLWSLFEAEALDRRGDVNRLVWVAQRWADAGLLTDETFELPLAYFRERYCPGGVLSGHFRHLNLRVPSECHRVKTVLCGDAVEPAERAAAILVVVYRYRNNLFHGEKWKYQLGDQLENFTHANEVLMRSIELQRNLEGVDRADLYGREDRSCAAQDT